MNTTFDIITAIANYDAIINGDKKALSYRIDGKQTITYGVTLYAITLQYENHDTTTAAISYDYAGAVMAIKELRPTYITADEIEDNEWVDSRTGNTATIINGLPRT